MSRQFRIDPHVVSADLGDEAVLLNTESGIYFGVDALGREIWLLLAKGAREDEIVGRLSETYYVGQDVLRHDVAGFLNKLAEKGLVALPQG